MCTNTTAFRQPPVMKSLCTGNLRYLEYYVYICIHVATHLYTCNHIETAIDDEIDLSWQCLVWDGYG